MRCPVYNMNRNQAPPLIGGNKQSIVQLKKHEHLIKHGDAGEWRGGGNQWSWIFPTALSSPWGVQG